jgi:hypothetical protein
MDDGSGSVRCVDDQGRRRAIVALVEVDVGDVMDDTRQVLPG